MIVSIERVGDGVVGLRVAGEIDMATVEDLIAAMTAAINMCTAGTLIVDLANVTFCDSSGIAAFDNAFFLAGWRGVRFRLVNPQPAVRRVLEITGVLDRLTQAS